MTEEKARKIMSINLFCLPFISISYLHHVAVLAEVVVAVVVHLQEVAEGDGVMAADFIARAGGDTYLVEFEVLVEVVEQFARRIWRPPQVLLAHLRLETASQVVVVRGADAVLLRYARILIALTQG